MRSKTTMAQAFDAAGIEGARRHYLRRMAEIGRDAVTDGKFDAAKFAALVTAAARRDGELLLQAMDNGTRIGLLRRMTLDAVRELGLGVAASTISGGGHGSNDAQRPNAAPIRRGPRALDAIRPAVHSCLDSWHLSNGLAIGDQSKETLLELAPTYRWQARVVSQLAHSMPPGRKVRDVIAADDLRAMIEAAKRANDHDI